MLGNLDFGLSFFKTNFPARVYRNKCAERLRDGRWGPWGCTWCWKITVVIKVFKTFQKLGQAEGLSGTQNTPSEVERERVLHIINKLRSLVGEGRAASQRGKGVSAVFGQRLVFAWRSLLGTDAVFSLFFSPLKANYSEILCKRRRGQGREGWGSGGAWARSVLPRDDTPTHSGSSHNLTRLQKNMEISSRFGSRTS